MNVRELIKALQSFDQELPVSVDDWNEQFSSPMLLYEGSVNLGATRYWSDEQGCYIVIDPCVVIG